MKLSSFGPYPWVDILYAPWGMQGTARIIYMIFKSKFRKLGKLGQSEPFIAAVVVVAVEHLLGLHVDGDDVGGPEAGGGRHVARAGLRDVVGERTVVSQSRPAHPETLAVHNYRGHCGDQ